MLNLNKTQLKMYFNEKWKARRTQQGLSTNDCAMLCGVSAYTLNKIENGFEGVKLITLLQIMEALGVQMTMQEWSDE